jgi:hypothetical protein
MFVGEIFHQICVTISYHCMFNLSMRVSKFGTCFVTTCFLSGRLKLHIGFQIGKPRGGGGDEPISTRRKREVLGAEPSSALCSVMPCLSYPHTQTVPRRVYALSKAAPKYQTMLGPHHPTTLACPKHYSSMLHDMNRRGTRGRG